MGRNQGGSNGGQRDGRTDGMSGEQRYRAAELLVWRPRQCLVPFAGPRRGNATVLGRVGGD